ncbi:hypothetical protein EVAR_39349_1 [Eumeta japonica]|uniref:Uncharacterized protein n=1 Tax=Eumeta variegata TaxID=151549 RepID=A0A4C1WNF2_EUMVA|nr:hypothetical protein EVAR_39349_1 [Eumeta japonica]
MTSRARANGMINGPSFGFYPGRLIMLQERDLTVVEMITSEHHLSIEEQGEIFIVKTYIVCMYTAHAHRHVKSVRFLLSETLPRTLLLARRLSQRNQTHCARQVLHSNRKKILRLPKGASKRHRPRLMSSLETVGAARAVPVFGF